MILTDCHMHSYFSSDSAASPEDMIKGAIKKGLQTVCFTDHEDKNYVFNGVEEVIDMERYIPQIKSLKKKYEGQIEVLTGVELGLQPHLGEAFREFTDRYDFDFIIGSVHIVMSQNPYYREFFNGRSDAAAYADAFEDTLKSIEAMDDFDVLGHLDYVVRYGNNREKEYSYARFADQIDAILRFLIERGKGLEINMAGIKYGLPFAHPHPDVLKRYRELGGEILTIGSDAHKPEHIAYEFDKLPELLKDCGFEYYTVYRDRKPNFVKIG